jgi:hypothetical protein
MYALSFLADKFGCSHRFSSGMILYVLSQQELSQLFLVFCFHSFSMLIMELMQASYDSSHEGSILI